MKSKESKQRRPAAARTMNIYLITRPPHKLPDFEEWKAAVVVAESEDAARLIHPDGDTHSMWYVREGELQHGWIFPRDVVVTLIGTAAPGSASRCVVLGSGS